MVPPHPHPSKVGNESLDLIAKGQNDCIILFELRIIQLWIEGVEGGVLVGEVSCHVDLERNSLDTNDAIFCPSTVRENKNNNPDFQVI